MVAPFPLAYSRKRLKLLYFVVKNHSFSDGNKRIAAFLFVWFMMKNNLLYREDGIREVSRRCFS